MLGAIVGDYIGSPYEFDPIKDKNFDYDVYASISKITDDSVTTMAVAWSLMKNTDLAETMWKFCYNHIEAGYGQKFLDWLLRKDLKPYASWGNGSAMRVAAAAWLSDSITDAFNKAKWSAEITHNHAFGIKGAQAVAVSIRMALEGYSKEEIKECIQTKFLYNLERTLDEIRPDYAFEVGCEESVPEAIIAFLESTSYEDAVRNAISLGGDADTQACIAGSIAEAFYRNDAERNIPELWKFDTMSYITEHYKRYERVINEFNEIVQEKEYSKTDWKQLPVFSEDLYPSEQQSSYMNSIQNMEQLQAAYEKYGKKEEGFFQKIANNFKFLNPKKKKVG